MPRRVFVSSVFTGLEKERKAIIDLLREAGYDVVAMEDFTAEPRPPLENCLAKLRECNCVISIVGPRPGWEADYDGAVSMCHAEFLEAAKCRIPVLAFVLRKEDGLSAEDQKRLDSFKSDVQDHCQYKEAGDRDGLAGLILAALRLAERNAEVIDTRDPYCDWIEFDSRRTKTIFDEVSPPFCGRKSDMQRLKDFCEGKSPLLLVISAGGMGKSRMLAEFGREFSGKFDCPILFAREQQRWQEVDFSNLPGGESILIFDDAHRHPELSTVLRHIREIRPECKIILSARPSSRDQTISLATDFAEEPGVIDLAPLKHDEQLKLATACLPDKQSGLAHELVKQASGNTLVIVAGGYVLAKGKAAHALLIGTTAEFRSRVFGRLLDDRLDQDDPGSPAKTRKFLAAVAALSPFDKTNSEHLAKLGRIVDLPVEDMLVLADRLASKAILRWHRNAWTIVPDPLADHLLATASIASDGTSYTLIDRILNEFWPDCISEVLGNAAEMDYRETRSAEGDPTLSSIWANLLARIPKLQPVERQRLSEALARPAQFRPVPVCKCLCALVDYELSQSTPDLHILENAASSLAIVAHYHKCAEAAVARILKISTNKQPLEPKQLNRDLERVESLLEPNRDIPLNVHKAAVATCINFARRLCNPTFDAWVSNALRKALARHAEWREHHGSSLTLSAIHLGPYLDTIGPTRADAIDFLKDVAIQSDQKVGAIAIRTLAQLLNRPYIPYRNDLTDEDCAVWTPEAERAHSALSIVASRANHLLTRYLARSWAYCSQDLWHADFVFIQPFATVDNDNLVRLLIYDALFRSRIPATHSIRPFDRERLEAKAAARSVVDHIRENKIETTSVADIILQCVESSLTASPEGDFEEFTLIQVLADSEVIDIFVLSCRMCSKCDDRTQRTALAAVLACLEHRTEANLTTALCRFLYSSCPMYRHCLAGALGGLAQSSSHAEAVVRTFGVLVNCEDDAIHAHLARSAFGFLRQPTKERIQQVTMIHWNNDSSRAESICFALAIESDRFSELVDESQAREVLLQIEQLEDMSGQRHAIWNFVSNCIEHHPEMTVQVLVDRIKKLSAADSRSRPHARQRLPYHFDRVRTGPASGKLVRLILEHSMPLLASDETLESDQGGRLVAALVPRMDLHGEVLASIANEATQTTLLALARLFRAYDGSMVLELDGVVSLLLRRAAAHGDNCLKEIHSTLYLAAYSISGTSAYKSTDTHQSRRAKRAEEIADKHKDIDSQTASFFQEIAKAYEDQHSDLFSRWIDDD